MSDTRLTDDERAEYAENGFLVRRSVFAAVDVASIRTAAEELCADLSQAATGEKTRSSRHYVFQPAAARDAYINWEPGTDGVVMGVEPVAHLHPVFDRYARHASLLDPCRDLLGLEQVTLFTEKLNVKRARVGGSYALHQDYPYWKNGVAVEPEQLVTALVALDDAFVANGALEVLPGSHRLGEVTGKTSDLPFERNEIDDATFDTSAMIPVEVPAGGVIFFGPFLVHRSAPNRSSNDRRAILYTYQRAGLKTQRENARRWISGG